MSQNGEELATEEPVAQSNELDIDDGTMPVVEDAATTDATEEVTEDAAEPADQVAGDDDGDTDATQRDEAPDNQTEAPDNAGKAPDSGAKPAPKAEETAAPAWQEHYNRIVEEFGETAAAPLKAIFEPMAQQLEQQRKIIDSMTAVATQNVRTQEIAYVESLCADAGIKGKGTAVYQDAEDLTKLRSSQGRPISPIDAVKQAIRMNGGRDKGAAPAPKPTTNTPADKAARLERLRSVPPKARESAPIDFENDDPATIDGTAPRPRR